VVFSFPVAMALATGTEAPSTAIAQLGQLGADGRRRFARGTLAATFVIVAGLTIGLAALAVRLHVGIPGPDSTQIADVARAASGNGGLYAFFQAASALLLLAAASSSFQTGPACSRRCRGIRTAPGPASSPVPWARPTATTPRTGPCWSTSASPRWSWSPPPATSRTSCCSTRSPCSSASSPGWPPWPASPSAITPGLAAVNLAGAIAVTFTLLVNLTRGYPLGSIAATAIIAATLYVLWARA
jgi:hypothetical protein